MQFRTMVSILFAALMLTAAAHAGEVSNQQSKFSLWLPDRWTVTQMRGGIVARNEGDEVYVVASPVWAVDASGLAEQAHTFIDGELDSMKISKESDTKVGGMAARALEGTGKDSGDDVAFKAVVIDPGAPRDVLGVLVYGDPDFMEKKGAQRNIEHILASLKPL